MIILRNKEFSWFSKRDNRPNPESFKADDDEFLEQDLAPKVKQDPKALEKFIYEIEKEYLPKWCSERDFIKDLRKGREDNEGIMMELNPHSRLISSGLYPKLQYWSFEKHGSGLYYSGSGD